MTTQTEALKMALEAADELEWMLKSGYEHGREGPPRVHRLITKIRSQPKEPEQNLKLMPREATPEMLKAMDECSMEGYDERLYTGHASSVYMAAWDAFHGQHCYCGDITNLGVIHRDDGPCHYPEQPKVRTGYCLLTGVCASEGHRIAPQPKPLTDEQADSIINGLRTCLHLDSKRVFVKTWLRDWAAHGIKEIK